MESLDSSDPCDVGAYRLVARLGGGGMGRVYLGRSPGGRDVAIKVMRAELAGDPEFRARFRREVAAARLVGGFHTAAVVDADPEADPPWMVTEYIPGPSLEAMVRRDGPLQGPRLLELAAGLAEGLAAIHARGLIHRDLKPGNVIMTGNGPRIIDFGIAKSACPGATAVTTTGKLIGTAAFMSPEQVDDGDVGPASDIFSLGSVLAFAAAGRGPFAAGSRSATFYAVLSKEPDLRAVPGPLRGIVAACLAKDPAARPGAAGLLAALAAAGDPPPSGQGPPRGDAAVWPAHRREPAPGAGPGTRPQAGARPAAPGSGPAPAGQAATGPGSTGLGSTGLGSTALVHAPLVRRAPVPWPRPADRLRPQVQVRPSRQGWRLLAASADGRWLASADGDATITAWQAGSGLPVRSWPAMARVRAMAAGPGGLLVVAGDDGRIRAFDTQTGARCDYLPAYVPGLSGRGTRVRALALDHGGAWLAGSVNDSVLVWDVADPREPVLMASLYGAAEVTALAFDDTGWRLAAGDAGGRIGVWDLARDDDPVLCAAGEPGGAPGGTGPAAARRPAAALALAWDEEARAWISAGADGSLHALREAGNGQLELSVAGGPRAAGSGQWPLRAAALAPAAGAGAVIDDEQGSVHVISLGQPASPRALGGSDLVVTGVAFAGSGMLALGGSDGALRLWEARRPAMTTISAAGRPVTALATSPDGTRLVASDQRPHLTCYSVAGRLVGTTWTRECPGPAAAIAFSPDGARLVTAGDAVLAWDAADGTPLAALPAGAAPSGAAPSGALAAAALPAAALPPGALPGGARRARAAARDAAGQHVAAAWTDGVVSVWAGTRLLWDLTGHKGAVLAVAFGPLPGQLVTAGDDETIRTWDLASGAQLASHGELGYRATALAVSPAGALAIGCADGTVRLHEPGSPGARTGQASDGRQARNGRQASDGRQGKDSRHGALADWAGLPVLAGHVHGITAMSFDASGRWLATASRDGTARVWDLMSGSAAAVVIPGPAGPGSAGPAADGPASGGWTAAVASPEGIWHSICERGTDDAGARIWLAVGLDRQPLPPVLQAPPVLTRRPSGRAGRH
jgi:WD40 repeat protein